MRAKIYVIRKRFALQLLSSNYLKEKEIVSLPVVEGIPDGATVHDIHYDWECQSMAVMVKHDSFDDIPDGQELPRVDNGVITMRTFYVSNEHVIINVLQLDELCKLRDVVNEQIHKLKQENDKPIFQGV